MQHFRFQINLLCMVNGVMTLIMPQQDCIPLASLLEVIYKLQCRPWFLV